MLVISYGGIGDILLTTPLDRLVEKGLSAGRPGCVPSNQAAKGL